MGLCLPLFLKMGPALSHAIIIFGGSGPESINIFLWSGTSVFEKLATSIPSCKFSNFVFSRWSKQLVCWIFGLHTFNWHESIAINTYNHRRLRFCWHCCIFFVSSRRILICFNTRHIVRQYARYFRPVSLSLSDQNWYRYRMYGHKFLSIGKDSLDAGVAVYGTKWNGDC